ncbi:MAG TPA: 3'-5' exonuclease, partial [Burkholderiaceae bacterium]|nr:3'-5' exonuclease [Burkholderiaceae bacterium]
VLSGGQSFFERAEIRDLIAYLRLLVNDDDDPAFIRAVTVPKRGVGTATLQALGSYAGQRHKSMFAALFEIGLETKLAARQLEPLRQFGEFIQKIAWRASREPAVQVLDDLLAAIDYRAHLYDTLDEKAAASRWQNVSDFVDWMKKRVAQADTPAGGTQTGAAAGRGTTLLELAQTISLLSQLDRKDGDTDAIRLTTIHASKGLEFPHVFIVGCEEGLLPHGGDEGLDDEPDGQKTESVRIEEERRLMYVAVTRAQRSLWLSWCRARKRARDIERREPSRFIEEMKLEARPKTAVMISDDAAKAKLASLRSMLAGAQRTPNVR